MLLVSTNKKFEKSQFLGYFMISRVLFDKTKTRALITHKNINLKTGYIPEMTEFMKKDGKWVIKEK